MQFWKTTENNGRLTYCGRPPTDLLWGVHSQLQIMAHAKSEQMDTWKGRGSKWNPD